MNQWVNQEWIDLCAQVQRSAEHFAASAAGDEATIRREADDFCGLDPPPRYPDLLDRVRAAARLAIGWQQGIADGEVQAKTDSDRQPHPELVDLHPRQTTAANQRVDEAGKDSFPASDPPSWTTTAI